MEKCNYVRSIKHALSIAGVVFYFCIVACFFISPFLSNQIPTTIGKYIWYFSAAIFALDTILNWSQNKNPVLKALPISSFVERWGVIIVASLSTSAFIFNYYDIDYILCWIIFAACLIGIPILHLSLQVFDANLHHYNESELQKRSLSTCKYIIIYELIDLLFMSIFNHWTACTFIFGILSATAIFINITTVFLDNANRFGYLIVPDFIFGLAITIYLIYIIPDPSLRTVITAIIASVFGGLFTLTGVALTIRKSDTDKKEQLLRLEQERKIEERKKYVPYINISHNDSPTCTVRAQIFRWLDLNNPDDIALCHNKSLYSVMISDFNIKNISEANIIIKGICVDDKTFNFNAVILEKGATCTVRTTENHIVLQAEKIRSAYLIIEDILGNEYHASCAFAFHVDSSLWIPQIETEAGKKYVALPGSYVISSISLPTLISN